MMNKIFPKPIDFWLGLCYNIYRKKEREGDTMLKFPINERVKVDNNATKDFYIMKCDSRTWYVEAYPIGTRDHTRKTIAGFSSRKSALECVEAWKGWMK